MAASTLRPVSGPFVWTPAQTSKESLTIALPPEIAAGFRAVVATDPVRSKAVTDCSKEDFPIEGLARLGASIADVVLALNGKGVAILSGVPVDLPLGEIEKIYWGIGLSVGVPMTQSARGDRLGYVQDLSYKKAMPYFRGYTTRGELRLHTDPPDASALMAVRAAKSGGASYIASSAAIYNTVLSEHPEILPVLLRGFPYDHFGEHRPGEPEVTWENIPFFGFEGGVFSCRYVPKHRSLPAYQRKGREFAPEEAEAYRVFDAIADRLALHIDLRPGEILLFNNFTQMHARTEFEDWEEEERKRLLLRLWLQPETFTRPVDARQREPGWWGYPKKPELFA